MTKKPEKTEQEQAEAKLEDWALKVLLRAKRLTTGSTTDYFRGLLSDLSTTDCVKRTWVN